MIKEVMAIIEDLILNRVLLSLNLKIKIQIKKAKLKILLKLILRLKTISKNLLKIKMIKTLKPQNL